MRLADFILENLESLLVDWERLARSIPSAKGFDAARLRDHAEQMLRTIAADLRNTQSPAQQFEKSEGRGPRGRADTAAEVHGAMRHADGFSLIETLTEYRALRATVIRQWTAKAARAAVKNFEDLIRFNEAVDQTIMEASERFERDKAHVQMRLREQDQRFQLAIDAADLGVWDLDLATDTSSIRSLRHDQMFGYRELQAEWGRERAEQHVLEEDRPIFRAAFEQAVKSGVLAFEVRVRWPDATVHWIAAQGRTRFDAEGRPAAMAGVVLDITARKTAERLLHEQNEEIEAIFAAAPVGLCVLDRDLRYVRVNERLAELNGMPAADHIGRTVREVVPDLAVSALATMRRVLDGVPMLDVEFSGTTPRQPGVVRTWRENWVPLRSDTGAIVGVIASAEDITDRRAAEEALQTADRQKDEFLAMLAHELRNPLSAIANVSEILSRVLRGEAQAENPVAVLRRQTRQLTKLVDDLLDIARLARGRVTLDKRPVTIREVIDQAVEMVQPSLREKSHQLVLSRSQVPLFVSGDRHRLVQAVGNVLHNASKYTPSGGTIELDVRDRGAEVEIEIRDNGVGISEELLPHVFDLFVQSGRTLDRSQGGLGIGLSVVKGLVNMHGGSVSAESAGANQGASVTIRLPTMAAPELAESAAERKPKPRRRVLVVDDNVDAAETLKVLLELEGHEVHAVYGAKEALETARRLKPEVMLLDIGLPQMDGYEVARRLRAADAQSSLRLIALTGYGQSHDKSRSADAGFDAHLVKPVTPEELSEAVGGGATSGQH